MTIKDLKEIIANLPDDMLVVITAYEDGYCGPKYVGEFELYTPTHGQDDGYCGKYNKVELEFEHLLPKFTAMVLERQSAREENATGS